MPLVNQSVIKALEILDLLGREGQELRLKDVALQLDLPESTVHRLLASLAEQGYVQQRERGDRYALGWKIVTLARSLGTETRLVQDMRPYLEKLLRRVAGTVNLAVLSNTQVMYVNCLVPNGVMSLYVAPGTLVPAHATALGKVLLAHLPPVELEEVLAALPLQPLTPRTITALPELRDALDGVRRQGYAVDRGEFKTGVHCVAAPIKDAGCRALAAISVTASMADMPASRQGQIAANLVEIAQDAARHLYGQPV